MTAVIQLSNVAKMYKSIVALRDVTFALERGVTTALLGLNGAGKSTTIGVIAGVVEPDMGVVWRSHDVDGGNFKRLGIAPQQTAIYPELTVLGNLKFMCAYMGVHRKLASRTVEELSCALSLEDVMGRRAGTLSGGQQRRLHTALALVGDPVVVLLDEPTVGADIEGRQALLGVVKRVADEGAAVLYTTHYLEELEQLAPRVAVLTGGRIAATEPFQKFVRRYGESYMEIATTGLGGVVQADLDVGAPAACRLEVIGESVRITPAESGEVLGKILLGLAKKDVGIAHVRVVESNIESAFAALAGPMSADNGLGLTR